MNISNYLLIMKLHPSKMGSSHQERFAYPPPSGQEIVKKRHVEMAASGTFFPEFMTKWRKSLE